MGFYIGKYGFISEFKIDITLQQIVIKSWYAYGSKALSLSFQIRLVALSIIRQKCMVWSNSNLESTKNISFQICADTSLSRLWKKWSSYSKSTHPKMVFLYLVDWLTFPLTYGNLQSKSHHIFVLVWTIL